MAFYVFAAEAKGAPWRQKWSITGALSTMAARGWSLPTRNRFVGSITNPCTTEARANNKKNGASIYEMETNHD